MTRWDQTEDNAPPYGYVELMVRGYLECAVWADLEEDAGELTGVNATGSTSGLWTQPCPKAADTEHPEYIPHSAGEEIEIQTTLKQVREVLRNPQLENCSFYYERSY